MKFIPNKEQKTGFRFVPSGLKEEKSMMGSLTEGLATVGEGFNRNAIMAGSVPFDIGGFLWKKLKGEKFDQQETFFARAKELAYEAGIISSEDDWKAREGYAANLGRDLFPAIFTGGLSSLGRGLAEAGASAGATWAEKRAKGTGWEGTASVLGALAGGTAASRVPLISSGKAMARRAVRREGKNTPTVINPNADPSLPPILAKAVVTQDKAQIENNLDQARRQIPARGLRGRFLKKGKDTIYRGPTIAARAYRDEVRHSVDLARAGEEARWQGAQLWRPVPTQRITDFLTEIGAFSEGGGSALPHQILKRVSELGPDVTLADLIGKDSLRSEILGILRTFKNPQGAVEGSTGAVMEHNLYNLQSRILDVINETYPRDPAIAVAREWSMWLNDRFFRPGSPHLPFLRNDVEQDPIKAMEGLLGREIAGEEVANISGRLDRNALIARSSTYIWNQFRAHADELGPEAGKKFLEGREIQRFALEFPALEADITMHVDRFNDLLKTQDALGRSAFAQMAGRDISAAVGEVFAQSDKAGVVRELLDNMHGFTPAQDGFRKAILQNLFSRAAHDPARLQELVKRTDMSDMMIALLSDGQMKRFNRILSDAVAIQKGEVGKVKGWMRRPLTLMTAIMGAASGRMLHTGTIQAPQITASFFRNLADRMVTPLDASDIFSQAVIDPRKEQLLHAAIPRNRQEARRTLRAFQLFNSAMVGALHNTRNELLGTTKASRRGL